MELQQTDNGALFIDEQGPFAPERLPEVEEPTVFSRRFTDGQFWFDVYASPVLSELGESAYEVEVITESREVGDETGNTSDYEYETISYEDSIEDALATARRYVKNYL